MSIANLFDKTITIKRLTTTSGAKKSFTNLETDVAAHIQPLSAEFVENTQYTLGKDFQLFCGITDLEEGDRVVDQANSKEYKVIGVEKYDLFDSSHIEAIIRIFDTT